MRSMVEGAVHTPTSRGTLENVVEGSPPPPPPAVPLPRFAGEDPGDVSVSILPKTNNHNGGDYHA
jgi:hypothetical protein